MNISIYDYNITSNSKCDSLKTYMYVQISSQVPLVTEGKGSEIRCLETSIWPIVRNM